MFDNFVFDSSVFFITGSGSKNGGVLIKSKEFGEEELFSADVIQEWTKRTSKQIYLLIIIDINFAGRWALDVKKFETTDVGVIASCKEKEKSYFVPFGIVFLHNFLKFLNKSPQENFLLCESNPIFGGDFLKCKTYTNFYCHLKDWKSLIPIQKSEFLEIKYKNGRYIGYVSGEKNIFGELLFG